MSKITDKPSNAISSTAPPRTETVKISQVGVHRIPKSQIPNCKQVTVDEYADRYKEKTSMPAPILFVKVKGKLLIGDGWHRLLAMQKLGLETARCEMRFGSFQDCLKFALEGELRAWIAEDKRGQSERGTMLCN